jgi:hypothetical protein
MTNLSIPLPVRLTVATICLSILASSCANRSAVAHNTDPRKYTLFFEGHAISRPMVLSSTPSDIAVVMSDSYRWMDYRDDIPTTPAGTHLRMSLWLAGTDTGARYIGFTAMSASGCLMNTLIIDQPDRLMDVEFIPKFRLRANTGE